MSCQDRLCWAYLPGPTSECSQGVPRSRAGCLSSRWGRAYSPHPPGSDIIPLSRRSQADCEKQEKDAVKKQLLLGWLGGGEVYCGQGLRTGAKARTSSPGHSLESGMMDGRELGPHRWQQGWGRQNYQQPLCLFPPCVQVAPPAPPHSVMWGCNRAITC